ncbi:MAG: hypothetical protein JHC26_02810 [Thermofilum sp.]|jgi:hypothetical protein|uniref:hypothetical protein n=1 Tax=Thermofilum sp. TaxID=1961369 RepID=UPI00258F7708|nr:hypothetical protein [Thermofilum sp.]MCI4407997.1 hypothetical protein [Thermofilum sp.]
MIKLFIEPAVIDENVDHIIYWTMGWLYRNRYAFYAREYDYNNGGSWVVEIYTRELEPVDSMFDFMLGGFGDEFRYFVDKIKAEIEAVVVCNEYEDECFDVWFEDLKMLEDQEHLEIEERFEKAVEEAIYGESDDPEYREYIETVNEDEEMDRKEREDLLAAECISGYRDCEDVVRFERMEGIRNDGDMGDAVFEQEDYE